MQPHKKSGILGLLMCVPFGDGLVTKHELQKSLHEMFWLKGSVMLCSNNSFQQALYLLCHQHEVMPYVILTSLWKQASTVGSHLSSNVQGSHRGASDRSDKMLNTTDAACLMWTTMASSRPELLSMDPMVLIFLTVTKAWGPLFCFWQAVHISQAALLIWQTSNFA